jgi:hypothetical protein
MIIVQAPLYSISFLRCFSLAKTKYWLVTGRLMALNCNVILSYFPKQIESKLPEMDLVTYSCFGKRPRTRLPRSLFMYPS